LTNRKSIKDQISSGTTVIADRYAFSGIAFSAAKGLAFDYCAQPDCGLPLPDIVLYLTLTPEAAAARGSYGEERYENVDMQQKTREKFAMVAYEMDRAHPARWKEIDASGSVEEVEERIWEVVQGLQVQDEEMGKLWCPAI
jgi:dTMP kinase